MWRFASNCRHVSSNIIIIYSSNTLYTISLSPPQTSLPGWGRVSCPHIGDNVHVWDRKMASEKPRERFPRTLNRLCLLYCIFVSGYFCFIVSLYQVMSALLFLCIRLFLLYCIFVSGYFCFIVSLYQVISALLCLCNRLFLL